MDDVKIQDFELNGGRNSVNLIYQYLELHYECDFCLFLNILTLPIFKLSISNSLLNHSFLHPFLNHPFLLTYALTSHYMSV
jgi:hypothetical protein